MKLLILFGPPAVGKTTVGQLIESQTDFKLLHNHMVMDGVMHIFGVNSPAEDRLSRIIREGIIEEAANAKLNLIFTYVWNFTRDKGKRNIDAYKKLYEDKGGAVQFIELVAPLETRLQRANSPRRQQYKAYAANGEDVAVEDTSKFVSPSPFFYPKQYRQIDTTDKSAQDVADEIMQSMS